MGFRAVGVLGFRAVGGLGLFRAFVDNSTRSSWSRQLERNPATEALNTQQTLVKGPVVSDSTMNPHKPCTSKLQLLVRPVL